MATLGNIRNRSGLLFAVIGIAMLAFILGDFMQSQRSGGGISNTIGEVSNEEISRIIFEQKVQETIDNWKVQNSQQQVLTQQIISSLRDQTWNQYIKDIIMSKEYNALGIDISDDEFFESLQGSNVHPEISNVPSFQNNETGDFDRTKVLAYLKQIDQDPSGEARQRWLKFQTYLIDLLKNAKYNALVNNAMYVTKKEAQINFTEESQKSIFNYVAIPYNSIEDSLINISEEDINKYYKENIDQYKQETSKDLDFVTFTVVPSEEDDAYAKSSINDLKKDLADYEDYELMAKRYSDNQISNFAFIKKNDLKEKEWIDLFEMNVGSVIGPYEVNTSTYRIAKLAAKEYRPDSVEARHILISPSQEMDLDSVNNRIDLIKKQIESGADFGKLAELNSEDRGSAIKDGNLGWFTEGSMVKEFNDICFTSKKGKLNIVQTQFGVHLVQVTGISKKVQKAKIVYLDRNVDASSDTYTNFYSQAAQFTSRILNEGISFDSVVSEQNLLKRSDVNITHDKKQITGVPNSREIVRWMNKSNVGDVSSVFQFDNLYVVGVITDSRSEKDPIALENVKDEIIIKLKKQKKTEYLTEKINIKTGITLEDIAEKYNSNVIFQKRATLGNLSIEGIGYDPVLLGTIFSLNKDDISSPVSGNSSIYIVKLTNRDELILDNDLTQKKSSMQNNLIAYSTRLSYEVLKEIANIKDNRSDFY